MSSTAVTRITHSCHLIEIGGRTFLTDPWFSHRPGYHPGESAALGVAGLPALDGVLISHHHYDHCDLKAFGAYRDRSVPMLVAAPVAARARRSQICRSWGCPLRHHRQPDPPDVPTE